MRPWRDIFSDLIWEELVKLYKNTNSRNPFGRQRLLIRVRDLEAIGHQIKAYHSVAKHEYRFLTVRIEGLKLISRLANNYLRKHRIDINTAAQRRFGERDRDMITGVYQQSDPYAETIERNVLTLARRSLRKAGYLESLREFYSEENMRTPQAFINKLNDYEPLNDSKYLTLGRPVILEKMDPGHRPVRLEGIWQEGKRIEEYFERFEQEYENEQNQNLQNMHVLLAHWFLNESHVAPFFLWLENHPISLGPKTKNSTTQVNYFGLSGERNLPSAKVSDLTSLRMIIFEQGVLKMIDICKPNSRPELADTTLKRSFWAHGRELEGVGEYEGKKYSRPDQAAFVWTGTEMFIAQHRGGQMHHSSFVSGERIQFAGMIKIRQGKVFHFDNHSGHYLPRVEHAENFARLLYGLDVIETDAKANIHGLGEVKIVHLARGRFRRSPPRPNF